MVRSFKTIPAEFPGSGSPPFGEISGAAENCAGREPSGTTAFGLWIHPTTATLRFDASVGGMSITGETASDAPSHWTVVRKASSPAHPVRKSPGSRLLSGVCENKRRHLRGSRTAGPEAEGGENTLGAGLSGRARDESVLESPTDALPDFTATCPGCGWRLDRFRDLFRRIEPFRPRAGRGKRQVRASGMAAATIASPGCN